jgi:propanol-preferring alcohol dehydrogenase
MRAMLLEQIGQPLVERDVPDPQPGPRDVLLEVRACAVCRTDLHICDGDLPPPDLPRIPGHEIVGIVKQTGAEVAGFRPGQRVGVPWLGWTCGECQFCRRGEENLCDFARFTGYHRDGGFAELTVADARYCFPIADGLDDISAAPLLCAGLIGYRCLRMAGDAAALGMYGFGAAAHLAIQAARFRGQQVFAFTRPGDVAGQEFARSWGAAWAGDSTALPPEKLDAAILFAPVGSLVPQALRAVRKGGVVVCGGIHMSDIPSFPYEILWGERVVRSVANLTHRDGEEFLELAARVPVHTTTERFPLSQANIAMDRLRHGQIQGAAVLAP